jgi:hypothetical protein
MPRATARNGIETARRILKYLRSLLPEVAAILFILPELYDGSMDVGPGGAAASTATATRPFTSCSTRASSADRSVALGRWSRRIMA